MCKRRKVTCENDNYAWRYKSFYLVHGSKSNSWVFNCLLFHVCSPFHVCVNHLYQRDGPVPTCPPVYSAAEMLLKEREVGGTNPQQTTLLSTRPFACWRYLRGPKDGMVGKRLAAMFLSVSPQSQKYLILVLTPRVGGREMILSCVYSLRARTVLMWERCYVGLFCDTFDMSLWIGIYDED